MTAPDRSSARLNILLAALGPSTDDSSAPHHLSADAARTRARNSLGLTSAKFENVLENWLADGDIYRGQQFSFDDEWRNMSIGNVLQYEQIAWLCKEGAHRYDMGPLIGPFMEYKAHWTEIRLPMEAWISS